MSMNGSHVPDLGAMRERQRAKAQVPPYEPGTPDFATQVLTQMVNGKPSFTDAIDGAVSLWTNDGWKVESITSCVLQAVDPQTHAAVFQVAAKVSRAA